MDYAERLRERGRYAEAETQIRDVIKDRIRVSGDQHYWTLLAEYVLCNILDRNGRAAEAEPMIGTVADGLRASLGDTSSDTLTAMSVRANIESSRSEEHTSELQSLMRSSYAVFCLIKKQNTHTINFRRNN